MAAVMVLGHVDASLMSSRREANCLEGLDSLDTRLDGTEAQSIPANLHSLPDRAAANAEAVEEGVLEEGVHCTGEGLEAANS